MKKCVILLCMVNVGFRGQDDSEALPITYLFTPSFLCVFPLSLVSPLLPTLSFLPHPLIYYYVSLLETPGHIQLSHHVFILPFGYPVFLFFQCSRYTQHHLWPKCSFHRNFWWPWNSNEKGKILIQYYLLLFFYLFVFFLFTFFIIVASFILFYFI